MILGCLSAPRSRLCILLEWAVGTPGPLLKAQFDKGLQGPLGVGGRQPGHESVDVAMFWSCCKYENRRVH